MDDPSAPRGFSFFYLIPLLFMAFAGAAFWALQRDNPDALPSAAIGKPAPNLTLTSLDDQTFDLSDLSDGKVKLVNFWASWCAPCRVEHPNLQMLADEGLPIYGVNYKDVDRNALRFLGELGNPYTKMASDPSGRTGIDWGLYGVPETFVIDGEGKVVYRFAGPITQRILANEIRPKLAEAAGN